MTSADRAGLDVSRIATANEATAVNLIEAGDVGEVTHVLAGMDKGRAASRLNKTAPERVALVLAAMDEQAAAGIAAQMAAPVIAAAFEAMPPAPAERIYARISFDRQAGILHALKAATAAAILQQMADWPKFLGNLHNLAPSDLVRFLAAMPPGSITRFFEHPNNNPKGAIVIAGVSAKDAALIIRQVSPDQAARWLAVLQPKELAAAVTGLHDDEAVSLLQRLPRNVVAGRGRAFVEGFGEEELVRLLAQLPDRAIGEWLDQLRGSLTRSSVSHLVEIMRRGAR